MFISLQNILNVALTGLMDEAQRSSAVDAGKGKGELESHTGKCKKQACEPPPPHVQEVTPEDMLPVTYVGVQKRISFIPGQEGGQRRKSYIEGTPTFISSWSRDIVIAIMASCDCHA